jgi:hypothetical protein
VTNSEEPSNSFLPSYIDLIHRLVAMPENERIIGSTVNVASLTGSPLKSYKAIPEIDNYAVIAGVLTALVLYCADFNSPEEAMSRRSLVKLSTVNHCNKSWRRIWASRGNKHTGRTALRAWLVKARDP